MMIAETLTGKELDYLRYYYNNAMTQEQIARMLDRDTSTISRVIVRGEEKLSRIMERGKLLWGEDFLE
jgi:IS30 family transposase